MTRRSVLVAASLTALAVVGGAAAPTADAAASAGCADVLVLGARGSGQSADGDASDAGSGMGAQTFRVIEELRRRLPGQHVRAVAVPYPASSVADLAVDPVGYLVGLETGADWTRTRIARELRRCTRQRVVLAGYSQGAMVMHRALQDLVASDRSRGLDRIDGVLLIADGDRDTADGSRRWGSAPPGVGIGRLAPDLSGVRSTILPRPLARRVHSVCDRGDRVCAPASTVSAPEHADVHTTHYLGSRAVRRVVATVAARVAGHGGPPVIDRARNRLPGGSPR